MKLFLLAQFVRFSANPFISWIVNNSRPFYVKIRDVREGKFYGLLPEKENTGMAIVFHDTGNINLVDTKAL